MAELSPCRADYRRPTGLGRGGPGKPKGAEAVAARTEDLCELLEQGYRLLDAAERLGVSYRTAMRYITRLRQGESGSGGPLGELRPGDAAVPGDELAHELRPVTHADQTAECVPQIVTDPDRPVRCVGRGLHTHIVTGGYPASEPFR